MVTGVGLVARRRLAAAGRGQGLARARRRRLKYLTATNDIFTTSTAFVTVGGTTDQLCSGRHDCKLRHRIVLGRGGR